MYYFDPKSNQYVAMPSAGLKKKKIRRSVYTINLLVLLREFLKQNIFKFETSFQNKTRLLEHA